MIVDLFDKFQSRNFKMIIGLLWIILENNIHTFRFLFLQHILGVNEKQSDDSFVKDIKDVEMVE